MVFVVLTTGLIVLHVVLLKLIRFKKFAGKINGKVGLVLFTVVNILVAKSLEMIYTVAHIMDCPVLSANIF